MDLDRRELYSILEISRDASTEELKEAYRSLVKRYHPDLTGDVASGKKLAEIVQAYKSLRIDVRRRSIVDFPVRERTGSSDFRPETDIFKLGELLEKGKTTGIRAFAARGLGNSGKKSAYAYLKKGLNDSDELVVKTSVEAVGKLKLRQSAGDLSVVFSRGSSEIKEAVLDAVRRIGVDDRFRNIILCAMKDADQKIRKNGLDMFVEFKRAVPDD
ncbi:MAG: DnaJ domain-containing protein [bacterium]